MYTTRSRESQAFNASVPGNFSPDKKASIAPPPVEAKENLSIEL